MSDPQRSKRRRRRRASKKPPAAPMEKDEAAQTLQAQLQTIDEQKKRKRMQTPKPKRKRPKFSSHSKSIADAPFGNYPLYYQYRYQALLNAPHSNSTTTNIAPASLPFPFDPRLRAIEKYIAHLDCHTEGSSQKEPPTIIDLGSNLALVGLQMLAMNQHIRILCVERDVSLVNRARMLVQVLSPEMCVAQLRELCFKDFHKLENKVLKTRMNLLRIHTEQSRETTHTSSFSQNQIEHQLIPIENRIQIVNGNVHEMNNFWSKMTKHQSISRANTPQRVEMITCFSLIKWIHLSYGDESVRRLFQRIYDTLSEGGHFVLEVAPWKSYKKRKKASKQIAQVWKEGLQVKPKDYEGILVEIGFELVEKIAMSHANNSMVRVDKENGEAVQEETVSRAAEGKWEQVRDANWNRSGTEGIGARGRDCEEVVLEGGVGVNGYLERPLFVYRKVAAALVSR